MLWLLRHAEAVDGWPDDGRPLTERGARHADAVGIVLARLGANIDACLPQPQAPSPADRSPRVRADRRRGDHRAAAVAANRSTSAT